MIRPGEGHAAATGGIRREPAVAGSFYPEEPRTLESLVRKILEDAAGLPSAARPAQGLPLGLLVPHAGLVYSGVPAAAAWRLLEGPGTCTVVILGTNHCASWLTGTGAWPDGVWATPLGPVAVDAELAAAIVALGPPFDIDREAHVSEHSIEVQLPLLHTVAPGARIVPLAVATGRGHGAIEAGRRLGELLGILDDAGERIVLAISTDMAHYPSAAAARRVTEALLPALLGVDGAGLATRELSLREEGIPGLACGMCGIEPAVLGLAALREMRATTVTQLAAATSADAGAGPDRVVGYLALRFDR
jgi:AmmeMemoRadiSam system protein B